MTNDQYDAFISHNSADKPAVESIAATLEAQGLSCFLDKWDILPSNQWLRDLENGLTNSRTILIFIGTNGIGPYQQAETDAALRRQIGQRQNCIIPVLLPGASPEEITKLSVFLQGTNALRFYDLDEPLLYQLLVGLVRGEDPNHLRQLIRNTAHAPADLLQTLNHWLSGLHIEWRESECHISEGQGQHCLNIPDLSNNFNPNSIEYLLSWKSQLTELFGREQELQSLHDWADSNNTISIRLIVGEGGTGKTRLAFEFARQLKEQKNWQAGEAKGLAGCWYTSHSGTLLVIDYPEQNTEKVTALLEALSRQPLACKLRVLLLGRNGDFLGKLTQTTQEIIAPQIQLEGLAAENTAAWALFQQAWQQLHERKQVTVPTLPMTLEVFEQWQRQDATHQRPLFVLALIVRLMLDPSSKDLKAQAIIRTLIKEFEVNRLTKEAKQLTPQINQYSLIMLRALAALSGQLESQALRDLIQACETLKLDIQLPTLPQLKETSLWNQEAIHALQPDLLAADLLQYALTKQAGDQAGTWQYLGLEATTNMAEASSILGRLIHDAQQILRHPWPLQELTDWVCQEAGRCQKLNDALSRNYMERTLIPLAIATGHVLQEQENSPQTHARHLNNLSIDLAADGQRDEALSTIQRAVEIYDQLAGENFAAYGPALALNLNNLSIRLAADGQRDEALSAIRRAVEIYDQLASDNFAAYGPALALSLNNLSNRLADDGQRDEALSAIRRAVEIREQLAGENFAAYGPDLAMSLNNLSLRLADDDGDHKELMDIRAKLQNIKQRILDERIHIPASHAWLFEQES